jgi:hypothetical protein
VPARRHRGLEHRQGTGGVIRPGEEWGRPTTAAADVEICGGDHDLAAAAQAHPGALIRFRPDASSDFAGAVGLGVDRAVDTAIDRGIDRGIEVTLDLLHVEGSPAAVDLPALDIPAVNMPAVNMVVIGAPPNALARASVRFARRFAATVRVDDRPVFHGPCTTVVIASGQFRAGLDIVPRGHPGDGRAEIQVYAVSRREARALQARLRTGTHVPHPAITQRSGAQVTVDIDRRVAVEVDGKPIERTDRVGVRVVPNAFRLLL